VYGVYTEKPEEEVELALREGGARYVHKDVESAGLVVGETL
jgi:hypothetical protein